MMKKIVISTTLVAALSFGGGVFAEEDVQGVDTEVEVTESTVTAPDSELYETVRLIEEAEYELTEDITEKILLQDEYAEKRLAEAEEMIELGNDEQVEELLEDFENHMAEVDNQLVEAEETETDYTEVEQIVAEKTEKRFENLLSLLEREDLPEQAKKGIAKAIENKQRAMERSAKARQNTVGEEAEIEETIEVVTEEDQVEEELVTVSENEDDAEAESKQQEKVEKRNEKAEQRIEKANEKLEKRLEKAMEKVEKATEKAEEKRANKTDKGNSNGRP